MKLTIQILSEDDKSDNIKEATCEKKHNILLQFDNGIRNRLAQIIGKTLYSELHIKEALSTRVCTYIVNSGKCGRFWQ